MTAGLGRNRMQLGRAYVLSIAGVCFTLGASGCGADETPSDGQDGIAGAGTTGGGGAGGASAGTSGGSAGGPGATAGAGGSSGTAGFSGGAGTGGNAGAGGSAGAGGAGAGGAAGAMPEAGSVGTAPDAGADPDAGSTDGLFDAVCSPTITFENDDPNGDGASFDDAVPDPEALMLEVTTTLCEVLYRSPDEPRTPDSITLHVYSFDGVANAGGENINLSTRHLANYDGDALLEEITGVLVHEATHLYQYNDGPGGLIEGIADYVRIEAGHHSLDRRNPGGSWDDGYTTTGFFISWLDDQYPDFGYRLNLTLTRDDDEDWSEQAFEELTGKSVETLWQEYQDDL
jgi:hypothetical protein